VPNISHDAIRWARRFAPLPNLHPEKPNGNYQPMKSRIFRYALLALLITGITLAIVYRDAFDAAALETWVKDAGPAGPILFMLI